MSAQLAGAHQGWVMAHCSKVAIRAQVDLQASIFCGAAVVWEICAARYECCTFPSELMLEMKPMGRGTTAEITSG